MGFDPYNRSLKIWKSIRNPTPEVGVRLGVLRFNSPTLPYSQPLRNMKCDSRASFLTRIFASFCLGREPKAKVVTFMFILNYENKILLVVFSTTNEGIASGSATTHVTRWRYCIKSTYIVWNYMWANHHNYNKMKVLH
jgi:hypothetical protein